MVFGDGSEQSAEARASRSDSGSHGATDGASDLTYGQRGCRPGSGA